jgi:glycosyltransferase involved in cell wall biosynthesis
MSAGTAARSAPSVSVVVTTRDRQALLRRALASVAAQTRAPIEVRVADDGERPADVRELEGGSLELCVLPSVARQAAAARNLAAREARGEVLAFLDDDDRWERDHLEGLAAAFADPDVRLAYRDAAVVRESEDLRELERREIARDWDPGWMRHDDYIAPSALAVRRSMFEHLGGFDESFRFSEDWDFLLRAAAETRPRRVPGVTALISIRESGNSSSDRGDERRQCLDRLSARHGLPALEIKTFWQVAESLIAERRS